MTKATYLFIVFTLLAGCTAAPQYAHESYVVPENEPVPSISVETIPDSISGHTLRIFAGNFNWAPEHAGQAHVPGEGHAHVYVDGVRVGRAYGPWYYLDVPGEEVMVELTTNDHRTYATADGEVAATASLA